MRPDKTSWDTSLEGVPPNLDLVDFNTKKAGIVTDESEIHAERVRRAGIQAQELAHATMRTGAAGFLAQARNHEMANKLNVDQYLELACDLARALYQQGQFDEALTYLSVKPRIQYPRGEREKRSKLADYITRLKEAVEKDDDFDCGCERITVDGITQCRRFERERVFSPKHNDLVTVKECSICGDLNVYPGLPERQTKIAMLRAKSPLADDLTLLKQI